MDARIRMALPLDLGDDPELTDHPIHRRPVPRDVPSYVEKRSPGTDPETVIFVWPDGAEAVWGTDIPGGFSVPRVPLDDESMPPMSVEEAEAIYDVAVASGMPEREAREQLHRDIQRIILLNPYAAQLDRAAAEFARLTTALKHERFELAAEAHAALRDLGVRVSFEQFSDELFEPDNGAGGL